MFVGCWNLAGDRIYFKWLKESLMTGLLTEVRSAFRKQRMERHPNTRNRRKLLTPLRFKEQKRISCI